MNSTEGIVSDVMELIIKLDLSTAYTFAIRQTESVLSAMRRNRRSGNFAYKIDGCVVTAKNARGKVAFTFPLYATFKNRNYYGDSALGVRIDKLEDIKYLFSTWRKCADKSLACWKVFESAWKKLGIYSSKSNHMGFYDQVDDLLLEADGEWRVTSVSALDTAHASTDFSALPEATIENYESWTLPKSSSHRLRTHAIVHSCDIGFLRHALRMRNKSLVFSRAANFYKAILTHAIELSLGFARRAGEKRKTWTPQAHVVYKIEEFMWVWSPDESTYGRDYKVSLQGVKTADAPVEAATLEHSVS